MAVQNPDLQSQCLQLIQGIKKAHEQQNDLLEKLVSLMATQTVDLKSGHDDKTKHEDPIQDEALGQSDQVKVDESASDVLNKLSTAAQQDDNLDNILSFASHSYKKRLQLCAADPQPFLLNSHLPTSQYQYTQFQKLQFLPRSPQEESPVVVDPTQSWKYWYLSDWKTSVPSSTAVSPVPDFMPWWQLTCGQDEKWYHIDDTDYEFPIQFPDELSPAARLEVPYSHFPGLRNLYMAYSRREGITYGGEGEYFIETGLTRAQRDKIRHSLGDLYAVPPDGRLPFSFHTSELRIKIRYRRAHDDVDHSLDKYLEPTRELLGKLYRFTIIDLTAPGGSQNAVYNLRGRSLYEGIINPPEGPPCWEMIKPALEREGNGFVVDPSVIQDNPNQPIYREGRWCRVIQLDGLANVTAGLMKEKCTRYNSSIIWKLLFNDNGLSTSLGRSFRTTVNQHLLCRPGAKISHGSENVPWRAFHISWYQLCTKPTEAAISQSTWNYGRLYGPQGPYIKQQAFTIGCSYQELRRDRGSFWTVLIMSPSAAEPDPHDAHKVPLRTYAPRDDGRQYRSEDIMLDAIRTSLQRAANAWSRMQVALDPIIDHDPLFLDPVHHDNLLFDDDTFSRSRRYFWIVSCLDPFQDLIDDAIEEWRKFRVEWPDIMMEIDPAEESREIEAPEVLTKRVIGEIEAQVDRLRDISARFEASRNKTKALREGLFSASGVVESRVSTRLGENVKLLTYASIFYLPLSFCVALWSIGEDYPRPGLAITAILVSAVTYIMVANLRNMSSFCSVAYRGVKRRIIRRMHGSADGKWVQRAMAFESYRPERLEIEPSEWYILYFCVCSVLGQITSWVGGKVRSLFGSSEMGTRSTPNSW